MTRVTLSPLALIELARREYARQGLVLTDAIARQEGGIVAWVAPPAPAPAPASTQEVPE